MGIPFSCIWYIESASCTDMPTEYMYVFSGTWQGGEGGGNITTTKTTTIIIYVTALRGIGQYANPSRISAASVSRVDNSSILEMKAADSSETV